MQIFLGDSHTRESSFCHLTAAAADAAAVVAADGEAAAEEAVAADAAAAVVAAAADAVGDAAGPPLLASPNPGPVCQAHLSSSSPAR